MCVLSVLRVSGLVRVSGFAHVSGFARVLRACTVNLDVSARVFVCVRGCVRVGACMHYSRREKLNHFSNQDTYTMSVLRCHHVAERCPVSLVVILWARNKKRHGITV